MLEMRIIEIRAIIVTDPSIMASALTAVLHQSMHLALQLGRYRGKRCPETTQFVASSRSSPIARGFKAS